MTPGGPDTTESPREGRTCMAVEFGEEDTGPVHDALKRGLW